MSFHDPNPINPPGTNLDHKSFVINSKIMLTTTILILLIVILMVSLHLYYRWYLLRSSPFNRTTAASTFFTDPSSTPGGLNPSIIKSLPIFTFSAVTAQNAMECSVCLSEFKDNESGRVMPNCKHTFHVDCIDMWFHSHSSCPLCRSLIEPFAGGVKSTMDEVAISISDSVYGDTNHHEGTETTGDSVPEDSQRKPAAIEISQRNLGEIENDLSRSHSFRSPMSRMISFTRNLSRDRRSASSSSSSIRIPHILFPTVSSMQVTELDIELGGEETR